MSEIARRVHAEIAATGVLRLEAARGDADEAGVLVGVRRDEDIVVGLTPCE